MEGEIARRLGDNGQLVTPLDELRAAKATGIGFTTSPAVTIDEFDKIVA